VEDRNTCMQQHLLVEAVTGRVGAVTSGCLPPCWRLKSIRNWVFGLKKNGNRNVQIQQQQMERPNDVGFWGIKYGISLSERINA